MHRFLSFIPFLAFLTVCAAIAQPIQWKALPMLEGGPAERFAKDASGNVYVATGRALCRSTNNGQSWKRIFHQYDSQGALAVDSEGTVVLCSDVLSHRSTDHGATWTSLPPVPFSEVPQAVTFDRYGNLYLTTIYDSFFWMPKGDSTWTRLADSAFPWTDLNSVFCLDSLVFVISRVYNPASQTSSMRTSTTEGQTVGFVSYLSYAKTGSNNWLKHLPLPIDWAEGMSWGRNLYIYNGEGIFRSQDTGQTWIQLKNGLPDQSSGGMNLKTGNGQMFLHTVSDGIYASSDSGLSWHRMFAPIDSVEVKDMIETGGTLLIGTDFDGIYQASVIGGGGLWSSANTGFYETWNQHLVPLYLGRGRMVALAGHRILKSSDWGESWRQIPTMTTGLYPSAMIMNIDSSLAFATSRGIMLSHDLGETWHAITAGAPEEGFTLGFNDGFVPYFSDLAHDSKGNLYAAPVTGVGMYRLTLGDTVWYPVTKEYSWMSSPFIDSHDNLFSSALRSPLMRSSDFGTTWQTWQIRGGKGLMAEVKDSVLILNTGGYGVYRSMDFGESGSWGYSGYGLPGYDVWLGDILALVENQEHRLFVYDLFRGLYQSSDLGIHWTVLDSAKECINAYPLFVDEEGYLYVGGYDGADGVGMVRSLQSTITSVAGREQEIIPERYSLSQNYPNPFNPTTTITYSLPNESYVTLKIYNVLGQAIETLVNERQSPGMRSILYNGAHLASGVYFYELRALPTNDGQSGQFRDVKKLIIAK